MGVLVYDPDESWRPWSDGPGSEQDMAKWRQPSPVMLGSHVMYRHDAHGDVTDAVVLDIRTQELDGYPTHAMHWPLGLTVQLPPWPLLTLDTVHGIIRTREARVRGSAGWLPLDWHEPKADAA